MCQMGRAVISVVWAVNQSLQAGDAREWTTGMATHRISVSGPEIANRKSKISPVKVESVAVVFGGSDALRPSL